MPAATGQIDGLTRAQGDAAYDALGAASVVNAALAMHEADTANPHVTTAVQVGAYTTGEVDAILIGYPQRASFATDHYATWDASGNLLDGGTGPAPVLAGQATGIIGMAGFGLNLNDGSNIGGGVLNGDGGTITHVASIKFDAGDAVLINVVAQGDLYAWVVTIGGPEYFRVAPNGVSAPFATFGDLTIFKDVDSTAICRVINPNAGPTAIAYCGVQNDVSELMLFGLGSSAYTGGAGSARRGTIYCNGANGMYFDTAFGNIDFEIAEVLYLQVNTSGINVIGAMSVGGTQVIGTQQDAIPDCDVTTVVATLNTWLAAARAHGMIAT